MSFLGKIERLFLGKLFSEVLTALKYRTQIGIQALTAVVETKKF